MAMRGMGVEGRERRCVEMAAAGFPAALQVYWHKEDPSLGVCTLACAQKKACLA